MYKENILHSRDHYKKSDLRLEAPPASFDYSDELSAELDTLKKLQLLDSTTWAKFVKLFKNQGVDDSNQGWRCEYWGKMMRGACYTYKCSLPDDELYAVLEDTVRDMLTAQDELGRITTYSVEVEFHGWDLWGRKYIMLGMLYFLDICRDDELADRIVSALMRHADYMISKLGREEDGKKVIAACTNNWDGLNSCSILEPFMLLYNITKEQRYMDFAEYIVSFGGTLHQNLFNLAYEDKTPVYEYSQTKAYEMISCFEGLAEYVKVTGNEYYRKAIINFANRVLREEATIIGCLGCDFESFDHASVEQFNAAHTGIMQETCVTVTWMKFMWQLWRMTGDMKYMDAFEISAYNAMSASLKRHNDPEANGGLLLPIHSYNPLHHEVRLDLVGGQQFIDEKSIYGCCVCISSAGFALEALASVGCDADDGIYVNLYRNGTFRGDGFTLEMKTDYPKEGRVEFSVSTENERKLYIRVPAWAESAWLELGGAEINNASGRCFELKISGKIKFALVLDMPVRFIRPAEVADVSVDVDNYISVQRGPIVFAYDETLDAEPVLAIDESVSADMTTTAEAGIECRQAMAVKDKNGDRIILVDYASAGQEKEHKVCAWMRTK